MRVQLRTGNTRPIQQKAQPQSRGPLTHTEQTKPSKLVWGVEFLLQLQRQYGNRYVRRVFALAGNGQGEAEAAPDVKRAIQRTCGGGQMLDSKVRAPMELALGADFGGARVHADAFNRSVNARAFTTGQDTFFRQEAYDSGSSGGRELLAHELTHVVQQVGDGVQRKLAVGQPGDRHEGKTGWAAQEIVQQDQQRVQKDTKGRRLMIYELMHTLQQSTGQPTIQRFAFCEPKKDCPKRDRGERNRARSNSMLVEKQANSIKGLLVGNFAISSSTVKKDLVSNAEWKNFTAKMATASAAEWEILGFTDCLGSAAVNKSLRQSRAKAVHDQLPTQARSKVNGFKEAPLPECITGNNSEQGRARNRSALIWRVNIPKPAKAPAFKTVLGPFDVNKCGEVRRGMNPAKADAIRACINHSRFVNAMHQAAANMKQLATPYAPGLADFYSTMLKQVVKAGQDNPPTPSSSKSFTLNNLNVRISSATTSTVNSITLKLDQQGTSGRNGSYGNGLLTLNETSHAATKATLLGDQKEIERVMYAEGLHFISEIAKWEAHRGALARGEFEVPQTYKSQFKEAVEPFWKDVLKTRPYNVIGSIAAHWMRSADETIGRVEEAIYLAQRAGKEFTMFDLNSLPNNWLFTADYWNPVFVSVSDMQTYINSKSSEIRSKVMPVIREIQKTYLRARPAS